MIVHRCIKIHPKSHGGWVIVMGFKVLSIMHYLIREKFLDQDVITIYLLQKRLMEKYLCWYAHGKPYAPHNTMIEMIVRSTYSSSNVHGVVDDNSNPYRNMVLNAMRMNHGHAGQCPFIDEEPNADVAIFLIF
jgi:hypothetical protein